MDSKKRDYSKSKIYKIVCNITGKCYVGHTTKEYLSQRLTQHRGDYTKWLSNPEKYDYTTSFDIIKNGNYQIILLELYPCKCIDEIRARERYWFEQIECVNKLIPIRTKEEYNEYFKKYREDNKEHMKELSRKWRETHQEQFKEYRKTKVECECGSQHVRNDTARHQRSKKHQSYIQSKNLI